MSRKIGKNRNRKAGVLNMGKWDGIKAELEIARLGERQLDEGKVAVPVPMRNQTTKEGKPGRVKCVHQAARWEMLKAENLWVPINFMALRQGFIRGLVVGDVRVRYCPGVKRPVRDLDWFHILDGSVCHDRGEVRGVVSGGSVTDYCGHNKLVVLREVRNE